MTIGYYQGEARDLRGNALVNAVVDVFNAGTLTPATLFSDAAGTVPLTSSPLAAAAGLALPGWDVAGNVTFFADDSLEYGVRVTDAAGVSTFRARVSGTGGGADGVPAHVLAADPHAGYRLESVPITAAMVAADVATQAEMDAEAAARAAADALAIPLTQRAATNGVATLGADSAVPIIQRKDRRNVLDFREFDPVDDPDADNTPAMRAMLAAADALDTSASFKSRGAGLFIPTAPSSRAWRLTEPIVLQRAHNLHGATGQVYGASRLTFDAGVPGIISIRSISGHVDTWYLSDGASISELALTSGGVSRSVVVSGATASMAAGSSRIVTTADFFLPVHRGMSVSLPGADTGAFVLQARILAVLDARNVIVSRPAWIGVTAAICTVRDFSKSATDAAMPVGNVVTTALAAGLTSAWLWSEVIIAGAGPAGADLQTVIIGVPGAGAAAGTITTFDAAATAVTDARVAFPAHGINARTRLWVNRVEIFNFSGNGWNANSVLGDVINGSTVNTNNSAVSGIRVFGSFGHGIFNRGVNCNAGHFHDFDVSNPWGDGVNDQSFLGNYYSGHVAQCYGRAFNGESATASSGKFDNCYSEAWGHTRSRVVRPWKVSGGDHGVPFTADSDADIQVPAQTNRAVALNIGLPPAYDNLLGARAIEHQMGVRDTSQTAQRLRPLEMVWFRDGVVTAGSRLLRSATATFVPGDARRLVVADTTVIPAGTIIADTFDVDPPHTGTREASLSAEALVDATGLVFGIGRGLTNDQLDLRYGVADAALSGGIGWWNWNHGGSAATTSMVMLAGNLARQGAGKVWLPNGHLVGTGVNARLVWAAAAKPTTGTYHQGDTVRNLALAAAAGVNEWRVISVARTRPLIVRGDTVAGDRLVINIQNIGLLEVRDMATGSGLGTGNWVESIDTGAATITLAAPATQTLTQSSPGVGGATISTDRMPGKAHADSTGTLTSASDQVTSVTNPSTWANGDYITGVGIPANTKVAAGGGTATLTLSANATASGTAVVLRDVLWTTTPAGPSAGELATAAGQIPVSTAAGVLDVVAAPATDGHVLTADLSLSRKVKWAAPSGGAAVEGLAPGSFLVPQGTLGTTGLTNGTMLVCLIPGLRSDITVAKIGAPLTIAGTVGSTSLRYGLWQVDPAAPATLVLLHDCDVLVDPATGDTEALAMLTLATPFEIPAGIDRVYGSVVLQGAPATSPTIRTITGVGSPNVMAGYPGTSMRPGLSRSGITGALPSSQSSMAISAFGPWIIVKTG